MTLVIISALVVFWTLFVLGVLIGMSVHREATRRRTHRLAVERRVLENEFGRADERRWEG
jgi:hypothetical protein